MRRTLLAVLVALPLSAQAQDYPTMAILYGTIDYDNITAHCDPPGDGRMHCSFTQVMVSRKGNPEEFEKRLPDAIDEYLNLPEKEKEGMCKGTEIISDALRTGIPPKEADQAKFFEGMKTIPERQKEDFLAMFDQMAAFCRQPNRETAESLSRWMHDKELRTCKVWTNTYEETFTTSDFGKTWISNEGPSGECGRVVISKFEKAKDDTIAKDKTTFWTYHTRTIITNKDAKALGLFECSGLYADEREFFYDWKARSQTFLGCDYVEFGF